jgi:hypothetical protein
VGQALTLQEKILQLKLDGAIAVRLAVFLENKTKEHGEQKIEQFYLSLGHNHIEKKGYDWEGLTLSREPTEAEKIAVKGVSQAQESAKESIGSVLLSLRSELIEDGLKGIKKLKPATYHELVLSTPAESRATLRERLIYVYRHGRLLVAAELGRKQSLADDEFEELDTLTDLTGSRVANDVQSRVIAAAARFALLGLTGAALLSAVQGEIQSGSVSYIDRASTGLANKVVNIGRRDEAENRRGDWGRVEYSALLDNNVCGPCAAEDGKTANNEDDLQPAPNPECEGGDWCRCFHVFINQ